MKVNPKNYQLLFRLKDKSNCLINEFLLRGPLSFGNPLIIQKNGFWAFYIYIDKRKNVELKNVAYKLYNNKQKFKNYTKSFKFYLNNNGKELVKKYKRGYYKQRTGHPMHCRHNQRYQDFTRWRFG